jgi:hypothetical protein
LGSSLGLKDFADSGGLSGTAYTPANLPGGTTIYARLWTKLAGVWRYNDYTFTTAEIKATLTYPAHGATNADLTQPVRWTTVSGAQAYYLYIGTTPGAKDLVNSGETLQTSYVVGSLPSGQTVHVRLWTKFAGVWRASDSTFTAASMTATLTSPAQGATGVVAPHVFQWTTVPGSPIYYLYVGTVIGAKNVVNTGELTQTSYAVAAVPSATTLYARMWTKIGGVWRYQDTTFGTAP